MLRESCLVSYPWGKTLKSRKSVTLSNIKTLFKWELHLWISFCLQVQPLPSVLCHKQIWSARHLKQIKMYANYNKMKTSKIPVLRNLLGTQYSNSCQSLIFKYQKLCTNSRKRRNLGLVTDLTSMLVPCKLVGLIVECSLETGYLWSLFLYYLITTFLRISASFIFFFSTSFSLMIDWLLPRNLDPNVPSITRDRIDLFLPSHNLKKKK